MFPRLSTFHSPLPGAAKAARGAFPRAQTHRRLRAMETSNRTSGRRSLPRDVAKRTKCESGKWRAARRLCSFSAGVPASLDTDRCASKSAGCTHAEIDGQPASQEVATVVPSVQSISFPMPARRRARTGGNVALKKYSWIVALFAILLAVGAITASWVVLERPYGRLGTTAASMGPFMASLVGLAIVFAGAAFARKPFRSSNFPRIEHLRIAGKYQHAGRFGETGISPLHLKE